MMASVCARGRLPAWGCAMCRNACVRCMPRPRNSSSVSASADAAPPSPLSYPCMPISALIADDEAAARSRLRKLLAPYSFQLIEGDAHDGLAALEAIHRHRPQVLFLDVQMPGLGGFEVIEALTPELMPLVVFVTAYDEH